MDIKRILQNDFILGQGTCLISTQNINSPKVLDGIEFFDNDFFFCHDDGALSKTRGNNHRQHFRSQTNPNAEGKDTRF